MTISKYLNESGKVIEDVMDEDPELAKSIALQQLANHVQLLKRSI